MRFLGNGPPAEIRELSLLVVASPRSGTRYLKALLRAAGLDAGHECVRTHRDAVVSSYYAVDDYCYHGLHGYREPRSAFRFGRVWYQIRHPLDTIGSLHTRMAVAWWRWQEKHTGITPADPDAAARFWLVWHEKCAEQADRIYRLEDIEMQWPSLMANLGREAPFPEGVPRLGKTRSSRRMRWDEFASPWVAEAVRKQMAEYGYEEEDPR